MSYTEIEHKLRIFISSRCEGKYTIARKALKKLLLTTGLAEVYAFEAAPASSEDTQSAYLEYVDNSNLCIFLIDNADGPSPAVLSEEKRAKDKQLRMLYLFCDENKKEETLMQNAIKNAMTQKYYVVHEFADIVSKAYDSVMQDIIAIYKRKETPLKDNPEEPGKTIQNNITQGIGPFVLLPTTKSFSVDIIVSVLMNGVFPRDPSRDDDKDSPIEGLLSEHLKSILHQTTYNPEILASIRSEAKQGSKGKMTDLLELRFSAQDYYYNCQYDQCLEELQKALELSVSENGIPAYIANDIAIDIRHVVARSDELKNRFSMDNPGQKCINEHVEPVYFPYLDRKVEDMQEAIAKKYFDELNASPYSVTLGGLDSLFKPLAEAYCIAEMHGSLVQTEITRDRLISIFSMLCTLYDDQTFYRELVRLLIINRDAKKLDVVIRTHNQSIYGPDIKSVLSSINNIENDLHQKTSKLLFTSRFGYYFDDATYQSIYNELKAYAMNWVGDETKVVNIGDSIAEFWNMNLYRVDYLDVIDFILAVFENKLGRFYSNCFKIISNLDYTKLSEELQKKIKQLFMDILDGKVDLHHDQFFDLAMIRFCKNTSLSCDDIINKIAQKYPTFYNNTFSLEMTVSDKDQAMKYINQNIQDAISRNESQGENGKYIGYAFEPFDVIYNIITISNPIINDSQLELLLDTIVATLKSERQTSTAKLAAVKLMQQLYYRHKESSIWDRIACVLLDNKDIFTNGYEMGFFTKQSNFALRYAYYLLLTAFDESAGEEVINRLFSVEKDDSFNAIQLLKINETFLENTREENIDNGILWAFFNNSISLLQAKEKDVRYFATICLAQLSRIEQFKKLCMMQLVDVMSNGSPNEKTAILNMLCEKSIEGDVYMQQIVNTGKADSNYVVRYVASRGNRD